jgi:microcystin-dependent protein
MLKKLAAVLAGAVALAAVYLFIPPPHQASAQFVDQLTFGGTSGGSANAQTFTIPNLTANPTGVILRFIPGFTNTGPTQINVSGLGLVNMVRPSSIGNVAFSGGEFQAGELTCVIYTGSVYQLGCNVDLTPIGRTVEYRGSAVPRGTLIEDGSCVSQTTYAGLFSVIGTAYGSCSAGLFALPDSRGTMFAALDNQGANGAANRITNAGSGCTATAVGLCGSEKQTLAATQLPTINVSTTTTSSQIVTSSAGFVSSVSTGGGNGAFGSPSTQAVISAAATGSSTNTGGLSHPILGPVLLGRRAIKF